MGNDRSARAARWLGALGLLFALASCQGCMTFVTVAAATSDAGSERSVESRTAELMNVVVADEDSTQVSTAHLQVRWDDGARSDFAFELQEPTPGGVRFAASSEPTPRIRIGPASSPEAPPCLVVRWSADDEREHPFGASPRPRLGAGGLARRVDPSTGLVDAEVRRYTEKQAAAFACVKLIESPDAFTRFEVEVVGPGASPRSVRAPLSWRTVREESHGRQALLLLVPLTLAFDLATLPVSLPILLIMAAGGGHGPR